MANSRKELLAMASKKNVGTLLNIEGKSKDHLKARLDLVRMGIRKEIHPINIGPNKILLPPSQFTISSKEKDIFCGVLKEVKVRENYGSNISRCVQLEQHKIHGLMSHDYHILMQDLLKVISNLEMLRMVQADADMILQTQNSSALFCKMTCIGLSSYNIEEARFPYWFLENVHTLESLFVEWSCFKKIFQDKGKISEKKTHPHIKSLLLNQLPKLQHICEEGSQIDPVLEFLEVLRVLSCSSLTSLMPSSVTLNHLTKLEITECNGLKYLISTLTARSLDKLTELKIKDCNSLEEVVNGVENVNIAFISLQSLMLECLPSLIKFCSSKCSMKFPLLEKVIVGECPRMKIFSVGDTSTPILQKVKIAKNDSEWHWKGNLNNTIYNMFEDKELCVKTTIWRF
ncbi:hypothetical protein MTR_0069s0050 [Medicago truncatula]|uniref:Disease resistance protein At4g27190-like leucine-rich repeats domain-containing protein n=1 Tax=Medicago truncatula TaxID=3880 RepID=A0A072TI90_MEDTR|nr:hypothetical protein MTR_0069s0050 [Medicago truncatula]